MSGNISGVSLDNPFEIRINGLWAQVPWYIFRSWAGDRLMDGRPYFGPVYLLGTLTEAP